jgi:hypothetical protein
MSDAIKLFAFFNIDNQMVAWEVAIGRVVSHIEKNNSGFELSQWMFSRLKKLSNSGATRTFFNELKLERVRQIKFKRCVSRLQGIYFFESEDMAKAALLRWNLEKYLNNISEIIFYPNNITHVDSEWVTHNLSSNNNETWMSSYWAGDSYGDTPLTEIIATGKGFVINHDLRVRAYKKILNEWPEVTPLLASAFCAFQFGTLDSVAVVKPGIIRDGDTLKGNYYIYMEEFDNNIKEITEIVKQCIIDKTLPRIVKPQEEGVQFRLPDLRELGFKLVNTEVSHIYESVHKSI